MQDWESLTNVIALESVQMRLEHFFFNQLFVWSTLIQVPAIAVAIVLAYVAARLLRPLAGTALERLPRLEKGIGVLGKAVVGLTFPLVALTLLWTSVGTAVQLSWPHHVITVFASLLSAWVAIRLASHLIRDPAWGRFVAAFAWTIAALNILGLLDPLVQFLDATAIRIGGTRLSLLSVFKAFFLMAVLLWVALVASRLLERRLREVQTLTPSVQVLIGKLIKVGLVAFAIVVTLSSVGIDITAFALFTGAIGVGIGFGLQKVVSNLISGVILLLDRSIKPGDVIEVGDTFGWVASLGARYVAISTRDGKEWLIPNEDLITQRVVNWSFSNNRLRLLVPIGVSYATDMPKAMALAVEAAKSVPRVLADPPPVCRLIGFGDSSVDLELRIWINDPQNGVANVKSDALLAIWDTFHKNRIGIPFPQRDVYIKDGSELTVTLRRPRHLRAAE